MCYRVILEEQPSIGRPSLSRGDSLPSGTEGNLNVGKDKPLRSTSSFDTATLYAKQGNITTTNGERGLASCHSNKIIFPTETQLNSTIFPVRLIIHSQEAMSYNFF